MGKSTVSSTKSSSLPLAVPRRKASLLVLLPMKASASEGGNGFGETEVDRTTRSYLLVLLDILGSLHILLGSWRGHQLAEERVAARSVEELAFLGKDSRCPPQGGPFVCYFQTVVMARGWTHFELMESVRACLGLISFQCCLCCNCCQCCCS